MPVRVWVNYCKLYTYVSAYVCMYSYVIESDLHKNYKFFAFKEAQSSLGHLQNSKWSEGNLVRRILLVSSFKVRENKLILDLIWSESLEVAKKVLESRMHWKHTTTTRNSGLSTKQNQCELYEEDGRKMGPMKEKWFQNLTPNATARSLEYFYLVLFFNSEWFSNLVFASMI